MSDLKRCPHCGSDSGYYVRTFISGWGRSRYRNDGTPCEENEDLHDYLNYKEQKTKYCANCNRKITRREAHHD